MRTQNDPDIAPPDKNSPPPSIPIGPSHDFIMGVYTQLGQIQKELGAVIAAQKMLTEQTKDSEVRVSSQIKDSDTRISSQIKESETRLSERLKANEDKLSTLKERVNRVFWTGSAIGIVLAALIGWKDIAAFLSHKIGM